MRVVFALAVGLGTLALAACGGDDTSASDAPPTYGAARDQTSYVESVNALCAEQLPLIIKVVGQTGRPPSIAKFEAEQPKVEQLTADFDEKVDALTVADDEQEAADAFDAYREQSDANTAALADAAESDDQATFTVAFKAGQKEFDEGDVVPRLLSAGFTSDCFSR
jgi:hypothetical protein